MRPWLTPCAALAGALLLAGCPRSPAPPPTQPPPIRVPPGCEQDLSGTWVYAERRDWRYAAVDDGGTLVMSVDRAAEPVPAEPAPQPDGGVRRPTDVSLVFERTPEGFHGSAKTTVHTPARLCEVAFPAELVGCPDGGLLMASVESMLVDADTCAVQPPGEAPRKEHRLEKVPPAPAADGGVADAGL